MSKAKRIIIDLSIPDDFRIDEEYLNEINCAVCDVLNEEGKFDCLVTQIMCKSIGPKTKK